MSGHSRPRPQPSDARMTSRQALDVLAAHRTQRDLVITNQRSARVWPLISDHPLDLNYNPSAMGGAIPLGLGLALAQPARRVIVISGDGSLLMNLGCLVTVASSAPRNLLILLLDNKVYDVTGGQRVAASTQGTDYEGLARAAGFAEVYHSAQLESWQQAAKRQLDRSGPAFVWLEVQPDLTAAATPPDSPPIAQRLRLLSAALQAP